MTERGFRVTVRLDIHAITCPGVWLCPNGEIVLRIRTLGRCFESSRISPVFPLLFHERFVFETLIPRMYSLTELEEHLGQEGLYAELIQWVCPCNNGITLACFERTLTDLLYPFRSHEGLVPGDEIELLMEPTNHFPGIIVPKIEVSTKTFIEEVVGVFEKTKLQRCNTQSLKANEDKQHSCCPTKRKKTQGILRQKEVCHSRGKCESQQQPHSNARCVSNALKSKYQTAIDEKHENQMCANYLNCVSSKKMNQQCAICSKFEQIVGQRDLSDFDGKLLGEKQLRAGSGHNPKHRTQRLPCAIEFRGDGNPISECHYCHAREPDYGNRDFYRNVERFYKGMYLNAKSRVRTSNP